MLEMIGKYMIALLIVNQENCFMINSQKRGIKSTLTYSMYEEMPDAQKTQP